MISLPLLLNALAAVAANQTTATLNVTVSPPVATACAWPGTSADQRRCTKCADGQCLLTIPAAWVGSGFALEISAEGFFPSGWIVNGQLGPPSEVKLDPLPTLRWSGWRTGAGLSTRLDWLPDTGHPDWLELGAIVPEEQRRLPAAAWAVRLKPARRDFSPVTVFVASPRASFGTLGPYELAPGGEVALCVEKETDRRPVKGETFLLEERDGTLRSGKSDSHGCVAFPYLKPGLVKITSSHPLRLPANSLVARVRQGESTWLGTIRVPSQPTLQVVVNDPDRTHFYDVVVENAFPDGRVSRISSARTPASAIRSWELSPGDYLVHAIPTFVESSEMNARVSLQPGADLSVSFSPRYVRIRGSLKRGDAPAPNLALSFSRESEHGRLLAARTKSDGAGEYETILPEPGRWKVLPVEDRRMSWQARPIEVDIPDSDPYDLDLTLPDGSIVGRVVDGKTNDGVGLIPVDIRTDSGTDSRGWISVWTASDGSFEARSLPEDQVIVSVDENVAALRGYKNPSPAAATLQAGVQRTVQITLERMEYGSSLHVVDASSTPIPAAQVFLGSSAVMPALITTTDGNGVAKLPSALPPGAPLYVVSSGHPWVKTEVPDERESPSTLSIPDPSNASTRFVFEIPPGGQAENMVWGLREASGLEVPLFFHLLRQGVLPFISGGSASLPEAAPGQYEIWVRSPAGSVTSLGTVGLPSDMPVVLKPQEPAR